MRLFSLKLLQFQGSGLHPWPMKEERALPPVLCCMPGEGCYHPSVQLQGVCIEDGQVGLRHC